MYRFWLCQAGPWDISECISAYSWFLNAYYNTNIFWRWLYYMRDCVILLTCILHSNIMGGSITHATGNRNYHSNITKKFPWGHDAAGAVISIDCIWTLFTLKPRPPLIPSPKSFLAYHYYNIESTRPSLVFVRAMSYKEIKYYKYAPRII